MLRDLIPTVIFGTIIVFQLHIDSIYLCGYSPLSNNWESTQSPCGQYGFRCIDKKSYQICSIYIDSDSILETPEPIHECKSGLICDEDNPAYCTPIDPNFTTGIYEYANNFLPVVLNYDELLDKYDEIYYDYDETVGQEKLHSINEKQRNCECSSTSITTITTTTTTTTEISYFTTLIVTTALPFDCDGYGFFPDLNNKSRFWYCDVPLKGEGYVLHHMMCGTKRIFDPLRHACILPGTTRNEELNILHNAMKRNAKHSNYNNFVFTCNGKAQGKYPNENDCRTYYFCLTKNYFPIKEVLFCCPENTAFDRNLKKCTRRALHNCLYFKGKGESEKLSANELLNLKKLKYRSNVNCKNLSRFRESGNCNGYFLCYGDQIFEFKCPKLYKFDDNTLECMPQQFASCFET